MNIIETKQLSYSYEGGATALDSVDIAIEAGKITAILGGNGAGKSTLFLNMNGVFTPSGGEVFFAGEKVVFNSKGIKQLRRRVGIVFQDPNDQLFSASVRSDIAFGALNMGLAEGAVKSMVEEVAKKTGVMEFIDRPTHALSFGQKKRVAIAGVLIMKPDVIILDEPTAGLDPRGVSEILELLLDIKNESGIAVIIATHDIDLVPLYCDYAYVLDGGKVVLKGTPRELFADAKKLRAYSLRTPRMSHLMEILNERDNIKIDRNASTISGARLAIKEIFGKNGSGSIVKNGKALRYGYTTGSCATAAATAAARMLICGEAVSAVTIALPSGERVMFKVEDIEYNADFAACSVKKDAGDDPDITDGIKIFARCVFSKSGAGVTVLGGEGVGVVTEKGLQCEVGTAAINPIPKKMIVENIAEVCEECGFFNGITVTISAPEGVALAEKTFNPRLGIVGGISILGTTGIVEPMSEAALVDTIKILIDKKCAADSGKLILSPGNYGRDYCRDRLRIDIEKGIKCSNFIGEALDYLVYKGVKRVLLVGHVGKLVKLGGGIMNTHSGQADCRMEIIAANAAANGASCELVKKIMSCLTTDSAIELLESAGICGRVFADIMERIMFHIKFRVKGAVQVEAIMFTGNSMAGAVGNKDRILAKSENADSFVNLFLEGKE